MVRVPGLWVLGITLWFAVPAAAAPITIMPLGDSITRGGLTPGGYRPYLWNSLTAAGYAIDFVGSRNDAPIPNLPDCDHEGHDGYAVAPMNGLDGLSAHVDTWLAAARPDVVLLDIGANDMDNLGGTQTIADRIQALGSLMDQILADRPGVKLFVANVYDFNLPYQYLHTNIANFDAGIPGLVQARAMAGRSVYFVDMYGVLNQPTDTYDGVHPSATGSQKMAAQWNAALSAAVSPGAITLQDDLTLTAAPGVTIHYHEIDDSAGKTITKAGDGTMVFDGVQTYGPGSLLDVEAGTLDLAVDGGPDLSITVTGGVVNFGCDQHLDTLTIGDGGKVVIAGTHVVVLNDLVIGGVDLGAATLTPEPATLALLAAGAAALAARRRRG